MNNTNSNLNISKRNKKIKFSNKNNFNKSSKYKNNNITSKINFNNYSNNNNNNIFYHINTNYKFYNSLDFGITKTNSNKVSQLHLPFKDSFKSSIIYNKKDSRKKNNRFPLKISNSNKFLSFNGINSKKLYNTTRKRSHNIRLNLNREIMNSNYPTENIRKINKRKNKNIFFAEKIKEKNNKINKLKNDLIISEMILNELKNKDDKSDILIFDKIFESINYDNSRSSSHNNITKINFDKNHKTLTLNFNMDNFNNKKFNSLTDIGSLLTFNYINNNHITYNNEYKKNSISPENRSIHKNAYFYSLPNRHNFKYNKGSLSTKNDNKTKIIFIKKSGPFCEKNINEEKNKINNKNDFKNFVQKCDDLKKRSKEVLNNYIKLSEALINKNSRTQNQVES